MGWSIVFMEQWFQLYSLVVQNALNRTKEYPRLTANPVILCQSQTLKVGTDFSKGIFKKILMHNHN